MLKRIEHSLVEKAIIMVPGFDVEFNPRSI